MPTFSNSNWHFNTARNGEEDAKQNDRKTTSKKAREKDNEGAIESKNKPGDI